VILSIVSFVASFRIDIIQQIWEMGFGISNSLCAEWTKFIFVDALHFSDKQKRSVGVFPAAITPPRAGKNCFVEDSTCRRISKPSLLPCEVS